MKKGVMDVLNVFKRLPMENAVVKTQEKTYYVGISGGFHFVSKEIKGEGFLHAIYMYLINFR